MYAANGDCDSYAVLQEEIASKNLEYELMYIVGDFNARTGNMDDCSVEDKVRR